MNYPSTLEAAKQYKHNFWSKQPIMGMDEIVSKDGIIVDPQINNTPTKLPKDFEWLNIDLSNKPHMEQLIYFLNEYYTNNKQFTQIHTEEFMQWYYDSDSILLCVKSSKLNLFVGFICGKIMKTQVNRTIDNFVEVRLLCVHHQLRHKKLVPCLVTELTRQFNLQNYNKALYCANIYINKPVVSSQYYLRALNVDKLLASEFLKIDNKNNSDIIQNIKKTNENLKGKITDVFKKMESKHIPRAFELFNEYMDKYNYHPVYTIEEFTKLFYNNEFVETYVYEYDEEDDTVIDFASYYVCEMKILKGDLAGKTISKGSLFYYTAINNTVFSVINNLLKCAYKNGVDVFCALNVMEHGYILSDLYFERFDQDMHYYFYNWRVRNLCPKQIGLLVMP